MVRDGAGTIVFNGDLAVGESRTVKAAPPVRVQTSDGAVEVTVDGQTPGRRRVRRRRDRAPRRPTCADRHVPCRSTAAVAQAPTGRVRLGPHTR